MAGPPPKYPIPGQPYGGFKPNAPSKYHTRIGYAFGVTMWLWIFYRAKQDLPHLLVCYAILLYGASFGVLVFIDRAAERETSVMNDHLFAVANTVSRMRSAILRRYCFHLCFARDGRSRGIIIMADTPIMSMTKRTVTRSTRRG